MATKRQDRVSDLAASEPRTQGGIDVAKAPWDVCAIGSLQQIGEADITDADARLAGYPSRTELLTVLTERTAGDLYRIAFHRPGDDPRAALREDADLSFCRPCRAPAAAGPPRPGRYPPATRALDGCVIQLGHG